MKSANNHNAFFEGKKKRRGFKETFSRKKPEPQTAILEVAPPQLALPTPLSVSFGQILVGKQVARGLGGWIYTALPVTKFFQPSSTEFPIQQQTQNKLQAFIRGKWRGRWAESGFK